MKFGINKNAIFQIVDKYFLYLALFFVLVIISIGFNYIVLPVWRDIRSVDVVKVKEQQKQLDDLRAYVVQLKRMRDQYSLVDYNDVKRLEDVLPRNFDEQTTYLKVQNFVRQSGLSMTSLNIVSGSTASSQTGEISRRSTAATGTASASGRVVEVGIDVGVNGLQTYTQFKNFLQLLEQEAPLLQLTSLTYPISGASATFSLKTYYLSE